MLGEVLGRVDAVSQFAASGWVIGCSEQPVRLTVQFAGVTYRPTIRWDAGAVVPCEAPTHCSQRRFILAFPPSLSRKLSRPSARRRLRFLANDNVLKLAVEHRRRMPQWVLAMPSYLRPAKWLKTAKAIRAETGAPSGEPLRIAMRTFNDQLPNWSGKEDMLFSRTAQPLTRPLQCQLALNIAPFLCHVGKFEAVLGWVPGSRVTRLVRADDRSKLSMALPFLICRGEIDRATDVLHKLATSPGGWLHTECVDYAARHLVHLNAAGRCSEPAERFVNALVQLLTTLSDDYWSRLPDASLVNALLTCFNLAARDVEMRHNLAKAACRLYGMSPFFWDRIKAHAQPESFAELAEAQRHFQVIWRDLSNRTHIEAHGRQLWEGLWYFHRQGNADAAIALRELVCNGSELFGRRHADDEMAQRVRTLLSQDRQEAVRLAAHPLPAHSRLVNELGDLRKPLRSMDPTAELSSRYDLQRRAAAALNALPEAPFADSSGIRTAFGSFRSAMAYLGSADTEYLDFDLVAFAARRLQETHYRREIVAMLDALCNRYWDEGGRAPEGWPPAPVLTGLGTLKCGAGLSATPDVQQIIAKVEQCIKERFGERSDTVIQSLPSAALPGSGSTLHSDVVVLINSHLDRLHSHVPAIRATWGADLDSRGIASFIAVESDRTELDGDVLRLAVRDAPQSGWHKCIKAFEWILENTGAKFVLMLDDETFLAVAEYFDSLSYRKFHYYGAVTASTAAEEHANEIFAYADGETGYCLSRLALHCVINSYDPTKVRYPRDGGLGDNRRVGDVLLRNGILPSGEDYYRLVRSPSTGTKIANTFFPAIGVPTKVAQLGSPGDMPLANRIMDEAELRPKKIWPTYSRPALGRNCNQLELISASENALALLDQDVLVVCVVRNEATIVPHFLSHYRQLGVKAFVFIDNMSHDGTRELLLAAPDVVLYSADTEYRKSHYGVAWQQAVLGSHALGRWVLLADADEFLVYSGCETRSLGGLVGELDRQGYDASIALMVDMYPKSDLSTADFAQAPPFTVAGYFDRDPVVEWRLGSGGFSNSRSYVSAMRHRLSSAAQPNAFMAQKCALFKYFPWVRLSEGLHYAANVYPSPDPVWFAHFKYHSGFKQKVEVEILRNQHFNDAVDYRSYRAILAGGCRFWHPDISIMYEDSHSFCLPNGK